MRLRGFDLIDLIAGLLVVAVGIWVMVASTGYTMGTLRRMGPGYLPLVTGVIMCALGIGILLASRTTRNDIPMLRLRPPVLVFAGIGWWALTIEDWGLVPATTGMIILVALAQEAPRMRTIALTTIFLVAFSLGVFVYLLRIPIQPFS